MDDPNDTQPMETVSLGSSTFKLSSGAFRLYKAANRIAVLEYKLEKLTRERDDLLQILKRVLEKL